MHNYGVAFSPDSKIVAWGQSEGGRLTLVDVESKKQIYSVKPHRDIINDMAFSPCGRILATASGDSTVKLLEADNGREIVAFIGGDPSIVNQGSSVAFSPDGKFRVLEVRLKLAPSARAFPPNLQGVAIGASATQVRCFQKMFPKMRSEVNSECRRGCVS